MPSYEVIFTQGPNSAMDDLADLDRHIQVDVLKLSKSVLRSDLDPADDDEQLVRARPPYKLRRAVDREAAKQLRNSLDLEPTDAIQAHDVWYLYRDFNPQEVREYEGRLGFVVERVLTTTQFAFLLMEASKAES